MKAQVLNGKIVVVGEIIGTPEEGIYTLVGDYPERGEPVFELIGSELHITGVRESIADIVSSWQGKFSDYKQAREKLKQVVQEKGGFSGLTDEEKRIAAQWFILTLEQIDQILTLEEKMQAAAVFNINSIDSRTRRFGAVMVFVRNVLEYTDALSINAVIMQENFKTLYTEYGQEGSMTVNYDGVPDQPGLFDFILSTPGTRFETTGVASFGITPKYGFTMQQVIDRCMDILANGNY